MKSKITPALIASKSVHERHTLYKAALRERTKGNTEAASIIAMIVESGLPYSEARGLTLDDPITLTLYDIVHSKEGIAAMTAAVDAGWPPFAGVDPIFSKKLGVDYGGHNMATATAGDFVANKMRSLGYIDTGKSGKLPETCVAKTARVFLKP